MSEEPCQQWTDEKKVCPPPEETVEALQDKGVPKVCHRKNGDITIHKFTQIDKLAGTLFNNIKDHCKDHGLTVNIARGKKPLAIEILHQRRHVDISETDPFFHKYGEGGKVVLITNNKIHCGVDPPIRSFQDHATRAEQSKRVVCRTGNDGLRLACILLDPAHRGFVSGIMSKKKTKTKSDVTGDATLHCFEKILTECHLNTDCVVELPPSECYDDFPEEERERSGIPIAQTFLRRREMRNG